MGSGILRERSWPWLQVKILGLLHRPPRYRTDGAVVHTTRLGLELSPPEAPPKR